MIVDEDIHAHLLTYKSVQLTAHRCSWEQIRPKCVCVRLCFCVCDSGDGERGLKVLIWCIDILLMSNHMAA